MPDMSAPTPKPPPEFNPNRPQETPLREPDRIREPGTPETPARSPVEPSKTPEEFPDNDPYD